MRMKPEDLFRAEKERAVTVRNSQHARLLAEAKAAFDKLMAEGQAARKSGRPRKHPLPPLKTASARTLVKPAALIPAPVAKIATPIAPTPVAKPAKPELRAAPKPAASAKRDGKSARPAQAKKAAKAAKPRAKAKPSKKR